MLVREMLGIQKYGAEKKEYSVQTLKDNVALLDESMLIQINELIVGEGHKLKKKEKSEKCAEEPLAVKIDSYAVETNVHFPTDYNLLWDSIRKSLSITDQILKKVPDITGWRKSGYWLKTIKNLYGQVRRSSHRGGVKKNKKMNFKIYM